MFWNLAKALTEHASRLIHFNAQERSPLTTG